MTVYLDDNPLPSPTQQVQITAPASKAVRLCTMTVRFHRLYVEVASRIVRVQFSYDTLDKGFVFWWSDFRLISKKGFCDAVPSAFLHIWTVSVRRLSPKTVISQAQQYAVCFTPYAPEIDRI